MYVCEPREGGVIFGAAVINEASGIWCEEERAQQRTRLAVFCGRWHLLLLPAPPSLLPLPFLTSASLLLPQCLISRVQAGGAASLPSLRKAEQVCLSPAAHTQLFPLQAFWSLLIGSLGKEPERRSPHPSLGSYELFWNVPRGTLSRVHHNV